jgi:translation initiation factor 2B subunit (eIF-2B alpha/beta/delta family)
MYSLSGRSLLESAPSERKIYNLIRYLITEIRKQDKGVKGTEERRKEGI